MENTYKLTKQGVKNLKDELEKLKDVDRKRNLDALKEARAQGDLSENALEVRGDVRSLTEFELFQDELLQLPKDYELSEIYLNSIYYDTLGEMSLGILVVLSGEKTALK